MPVPAGNTFVSDVSMPSYVSVLPDAAAARTMRWSRRAQPELTSMKSPVEMPCGAVVVATAGLALVTALTVSAAS
jgi:hypothetical protein